MKKAEEKLATMLKARKGVKALREAVCAKVCAKPPPPLPAGRTPGPAFVPNYVFFLTPS